MYFFIEWSIVAAMAGLGMAAVLVPLMRKRYE